MAITSKVVRIFLHAAGGLFAVAILVVCIRPLLMPTRYSVDAIHWQQRFRQSIDQAGRVNFFQLAPASTVRIYFLDMYDFYQGGYEDVFLKSFNRVEWLFWGGRDLDRYWIIVFETREDQYFAFWVDEKLVGRPRGVGRELTDPNVEFVLRQPAINTDNGCSMAMRPCLVRSDKQGH